MAVGRLTTDTDTLHIMRDSHLLLSDTDVTGLQLSRQQELVLLVINQHTEAVRHNSPRSRF